jgi:asparagine synthase (glutamine-hydrolysing)
MQAQASMPVRTFTIGFREAEFDEAGYAHDVARHLGTDHTELYVSPAEAREVIPLLPKLYDEPFADPSQIPTFALAQMTRRFVTVSLSGDGGDELFGGYERYFRAERVRKTLAWVPKPMRVLANQSASAIPATTWDRGIGLLRKFSGDGLANDLSGHRIHVLADILGHKSSEDMYRSFMSTWKDPVNIVKGSSEPNTVQSDPEAWAKVDNFSHHMMYVDLVDYLPDDLMVKVDRASMGVSLEARAPFLDHRVVEFAWKLPLEMKIRDGQSKWLLRRVLDDYVPDELIDRPKMGFGIPLAEWQRGPLREWAETLLDESRLRDEGFLDPAPIRHCWQEHLSATRDWKHQLWNVLMFQAWLEDSRLTQVESTESLAMMAS